VAELLSSDNTIDKIFIQRSAQGEIISQIRRQAAEKEIPVQHVPPEKLNSLTGGNHQGVIAFTTEIDFLKTEQLLPHIIESGETPLLLILDGITDVRNFGSIARTAYAAGVHGLIIPATNSAPVNADAVKTSAGALNKITVCREKNLPLTLEYLKQNGIAIIGTDSKADNFIYDADFTIPLVIIVGSEDEGISGASRKYLTQTVKIPMRNFDSFNVAVSSGIILYEVMRQRAPGDVQIS
jgi:23S rRNA (guanosine2251-2'-O)-methyltransferase